MKINHGMGPQEAVPPSPIEGAGKTNDESVSKAVRQEAMNLIESNVQTARPKMGTKALATVFGESNTDPKAIVLGALKALEQAIHQFKKR